MFIVNLQGLTLINQVNDFYVWADTFGVPINDDDLRDDSLACISGCLSCILENGVNSKEEFDLNIGGSWEACLPYLTQI
jgi:hypothetical protein